MNRPLTKAEWEASLGETWSAVIKSAFADEIKAAVEAEREAILRMSQEQWFKTQAEFEAAIRARGGDAS